jgi:hypothetical protein
MNIKKFKMFESESKIDIYIEDIIEVLNVNMNDISCVDNDDDNMEYEYDGDDYYVFTFSTLANAFRL